MSYPNDYSSLINGVLDAQKWNENSRFEKGSLKTTSSHLEDPAKIRELIAQFDAKAGWIQSASSVVAYDELDDAIGHILSAELAGEDKSLHIRQAPQGGWTATYFERTQDDSGLISTKKFLARKPHKEFHYEIAWRLETTADGLQEFRPYASRLILRPQGE